MPTIEINYVAIAIAVVANFLLGFLWYTPLFGKAWAKEMGFDFHSVHRCAHQPPTLNSN